MSMYTTGELAKKCGVSVRTVQYYDERGILIPSELSEGGRRLFSDKDVHTLETICFLRSLGISIKDIADILKSDESKEVITMLLEKQMEELSRELSEKSEQLAKIRGMQNEMQSFGDASENSIHDISKLMTNKKKLTKVHINMILMALPATAFEWTGIILWIAKGWWWAFAIGMALAIALIIPVINYWYNRTNYICPECHTEFKPGKGEAFLANHTPKTRKLTCPHCARKVWCIETYADMESKK